jgi:hypothetical protein
MKADLEPTETDLIGSWVLGEDRRMRADETCQRIEWLIRHRLERVAVGAHGWEVLFRDPRDGRFWERTFPQGEMHGGGPPRLTLVTQDEVREK